MRRWIGWGLAAASLVAAGGYYELHNRAPIAADDSGEVTAGQALTIDVLDNDTDANHDTLTVASVSATPNAEVTLLGNGKVEYRPNAQFFGTDTFSYEIRDGRGGTATAAVMVDVHLVLPVFLRRTGPASLSEMLQQPPTNIYGSSINIFAYRDRSGRLAEITEAGHADSTTCRKISGLEFNTLLNKGAVTSDFVIAGATRLIGASELDEAADEENDDPDLIAYKQALAAEQTAEAAGTEPDPETVKALDELGAKDSVQRFRSGRQRQAVLENYLEEAQLIAKESGLVRVHVVDASILTAAHSRLDDAVASGKPALLRFDDLLADASAEGVAMLPMIDLGTKQPLVISLPVGEFSKGGFAEAVAEHRGAVETAMIGDAQRRETFAQGKIKDSEADIQACSGLNESELSEEVILNQKCTPDGCFQSSSPQSTTRRDYCERVLPGNKDLATLWLEEARRISSSVKDKANASTLDQFTHAALIDSMLRNWDLPVGGFQAAFNHWLVDRRGPEWELVTAELDRRKIDRRALAGENIVFSATIVDDRLELRPVMVVDLRRSLVVVEPKVGVTAIVDAWSERSATSEKASVSPKLTLASLGDEASLRSAFEQAPSESVKALFTAWTAETSREDPSYSERVAHGRQLSAMVRSDALDASVASIDSSAFSEWSKATSNIILQLKDSKVATAEVILRTALSTAKRLVAENPDNPSAATAKAWALLARVQDNTLPGPDFYGQAAASLQESLGVGPERILDLLLRAAIARDASFTKAALDKQGWPDKASALEQKYATLRIEPQSLIDVEVTRTDGVLGLLTQRSLLLQALGALDGTPNKIVWSDVVKAIQAAKEAGGEEEIGRYLDDIAAKIRDHQQLSADGETKDETLFANEIASYLYDIADAMLRQATLDEGTISRVRFSPTHDRLAAYLAFEDGRYSVALERFFPGQLPLAMAAPNLKWQALAGDSTTPPDEIRVRVGTDGAMIFSARLGTQWSDVLQVSGMSAPDAKAVGEAFRSLTADAWAQGERVSDQLLIRPVPLRPAMATASSEIRNDTIALALTKAMVYGCVPPASDLVPNSALCHSEAELGALHDRVADGGNLILVPNRDELKVLAQQKFQISH
ncbi:hypothetical protein ELI07_32865 (plasmid) [Rhizobium leguminosarum]|uniref:Ig-like domain-containing protein n=1 Tax=Rhizobium leguminosarum TaxID=384 RepID=UPI0010318C69|nr:Ig-like domain-containing protein [Rhizobium leguminosarum]TAX01978.1 hypothetical protein ELI07_32865 [Rhizobium leguminosarum]TAZ03246.1 hypothetical protein ELH81_31020 [Rhizobium leguminosarum]